MSIFSSSTRRPLRVFLAICIAACAVLALGAGRAPAASDSTCWQRVLHDWFVDGRIDGTYPPKCLNQAMGHLGPDAQQYSSFQDEARRALAADRRWQRDHPKRRAHYNLGIAGRGGGDGKTGPPTLHPNGGGGHPSASGPVGNLFSKTQPSDPTSVPVPLLVLGGVAALLLLAAAASFAARRIQARRLQTAPAPLARDAKRS
jgi:hypothetical protein